MAVPLPSRREPDSHGASGAAGPLSSDNADPHPLRTIAEGIVAHWDDRSSGWMAQKEEVQEALTRIEVEIERIRAGRGLPSIGEPPARPLLDHRLCEAIRIELLRDWAGTQEGCVQWPPQTILEVLAALEEYRGLLRPGGTEELAARLAEPDAFELVVELAHDLRSPLNSILFLSEVLRSGHSGPVTDHQWKQLGLVYSATLGIVSVVSDVMDLASEQKGTVIEDPSPFSIGSVFDSVQKMVGPMAEEKGISLEFRLPDYDRCLGTPGPLGRILLNLTTNALKFTDDGWVRVSAEKLGRSIVEFSVQDTGRGIREEEIGRLFQPFRKSPHRSGYFFSGSGLGLSIVKRLLAALGSELKIETTMGEGSRFSFRVELPTVSAV
jgi:signal transduction histidine kinase